MRAMIRSKDMTIVNLFLAVDGAQDFPLGRRRHAKFSFSILNLHSEEKACQLQEYFRVSTEKQAWFDVKKHTHSGATPINLGPFQSKYGGFVLNGQVKIVVEINHIQDVSSSHVSEEEEDVCNESNLGGDDELIDVYGIPLLPSERLFLDSHPLTSASFMIGTDMDPCMKRAFLYLLTGLLESLSKPPQKISNDCFKRARAALVFIRDAWLKVDWVEKTLDDVAKKMEECVEKVGQDADIIVSEESNQHLENSRHDGFLNEANQLIDDVYGIPLLPSEVPSMRRFFDNHPDTAASFMLGTDMDPCMKRAFLYLLTGLLESLSKPQKNSKACFKRAQAALVFIRDAGLKVDWVEQTLDEMAKKIEV